MLIASEYVRVNKAAELLGVSPGTIRIWAPKGKIKSRRHPVNNHRLFAKADIMSLLQDMEAAKGETKTNDDRQEKKKCSSTE